MKSQTLGFGMLAAGLFILAGTHALTAIQRDRAKPSPILRTSRQKQVADRYRITLGHDMKPFGLYKGDLLTIYPDALIYLGDLVALKSGGGELTLARYRDEYMDRVFGLVVKEPQSVNR